MALFGLFGGKKKDAQQKGDFFLDFEEAQTLGDTGYMKKPNTIKRTFPKVRGSEGATRVTQVSSEAMRNVDATQTNTRTTDGATPSFSTSSFSAPATSTDKAPNPPAPAAPKSAPKSDTSMDMFRNMAKNIRS